MDLRLATSRVQSVSDLSPFFCAPAQLGLPGSVIPLDTYNAFQGQTQLLLFNGLQWGLWNIRGASATNFIGSFQR